MPHADIPQITAVILAGGKARRMGGDDKGWVTLAGKPLVSHVLERIQPQVAQTLINANRSQDAYGSLGVPVVSDLQGSFEGPLMGIATGLTQSATDWVLFVPCDTPHLPDDLARRMAMVAAQKNPDVVVAHDGNRLQSVVVLVHKRALPSLQRYLDSGERRVDRWFDSLNRTEADFSDQPEAFINLNTRDDLDALHQMPVLLGFVAWSGTGKTTLLCKVLPLLKEAGVRVGVIKHAHHKFEVDHPGKDSYELRKAGADQMLVCSHRRWALMAEEDQGDYPQLAHMLNKMDHSTLDLVLVEGFKEARLPKVEVHRTGQGKPLIYPDDADIVAVASDAPLTLPEPIRPLDMNAPQQVCDYIVEYLGRARAET